MKPTWLDYVITINTIVLIATYIIVCI